jgi:carboxyl-terminal processing protease
MALNNKKQSLSFLILVIFGSFGVGFITGSFQKVCKVCPPEDLDFSLFWQSYHILQDKFVDKDKFDTQKMIYGAISGMVESLGDPYTVFFTPDDTKRFIEDVKGFFEGVGMEIGIREGQLQVIAPLEGTPAQRAGLRAGDKIIRVDDTLTSDLTVDEAVDLIRGPRGSEVVLTIYREEWGETRDFKIVRDIVEVPSLKWELIVPEDEEKEEEYIAYIKLYQFSERASYDFSKVAFEILISPAKRIILDLRNNPGGYLNVAQDIAGLFLKQGEIVVIEDFGDGSKKEYRSEGSGSLLGYKVVVLINKGSASGSEILAGCLRDNRDVILIGETTFGKGSVQEFEKLSGGSSLKITVAKWLTPNGELITNVGLEPDLKVEITEEDYIQDKDPQLDKAIETIKGL